MGIQDRDWYREEVRRKARIEQEMQRPSIAGSRKGRNQPPDIDFLLKPLKRVALGLTLIAAIVALLKPDLFGYLLHLMGLIS